jgi:hypothetical protein
MQPHLVGEQVAVDGGQTQVQGLDQTLQGLGVLCAAQLQQPGDAADALIVHRYGVLAHSHCTQEHAAMLSFLGENIQFLNISKMKKCHAACLVRQ